MDKETYPRRNVLLCALGIDRDDVGEGQMAYEWIRRLSAFVNLWVITAGARLHKICGLEGCENVTLIKIKPVINFEWWDSFYRAAHPEYVEFFYRARKIVKKLIKEKHIDLCHHLAPFALRYPSPFIWSNVPFVVGPIYGGLRAPVPMEEFAGKESIIFKLRALDSIRMRFDPLLNRHYRQANRLIISAPYVKELLPRQCRGKTEVISGIALNRNSISIRKKEGSSDRIRMVSVSRIIASKGLELLILALARCHSKDNIVLEIYGCGPQERQYRELSSRLSIAEKIEWKGFVQNEEVLRAYTNADIFVLPSLKEPAGIAVIEAMSMGLPVLCVDAGGPAFTVDGDCGIKVPLTNKEQMVNDLASAIDTMASDPEKRRAMGRNALLRVKREFTWDAVVSKMLKVYEEVIDEGYR